MYNALKWFAGFTVIQLIRNGISDVSSQEQSCEPVTETYLNCYKKPLKEIPPGTEKIQALNISSIPKIENLNPDALASYGHLKELSMVNLRDWNIPADFLTPLKELEVLNITCTNFGSTLKFPSSIKKLSADRLGLPSGSLSSYDFSHLDKLNEISLRSNGIKQLPNLNERAPIVCMDLSDNPITNISHVQLAQYCQLRNLKLNFESNLVDSCCVVKVWVTEFEIENALNCTKTNIECTEDKYPLDVTALDIYNECRKITTNDELLSNYSLLVNMAVVFVIFGAVALVAFQVYRSRTVKAQQENKILKEADTMSAKEEGVAEEENVEEQSNKGEETRFNQIICIFET